MPRLNYPPAQAGDITDDYHGTPVPDPYRWLENPDSAETQAFVAAQRALSEGFLAALPMRDRLRARLTALWDFSKYFPPSRRGDHYFYAHQDGLQNQPVLYALETLNGQPRPVLDPNTLSSDGTVALTGGEFSKDGRLLAYLTSASGSDRQLIRIRRTDTGEDYPETLDFARFSSVAWTPDASGFYYNRYPDPATVDAEQAQVNNRLCFHRLGTPQTEDALIYERPDAPELNFPPSITDDGRYLVLYVWHGAVNRNRVYYRDLHAETGDFIRLLDTADALYNFIGNDGGLFLFQTDLDAPNGRVIAVDTANPARSQWQTLIPESADTLVNAQIINHQLVVQYLQDAHSVIRLHALDGTFIREVALPALGTVSIVTGRTEDSEMFLRFESFLYPPTIFRYNFASDELETFRAPEVNFDPSGYETRQVFFTSKDGTRVPMFLTHKRGLALDGHRPVMLYGYGGYGINLTPYFSVAELAWIEAGGVYAVVNLRGGGEYGEAWHQAGMLANKQNVFDDFIAAAEDLIAQGYTRRERLAIMGGSNGGLLVSACLVQRPDLFGVAIPRVPVTDMLRYQHFTAGRYWTPEYGDAEADPEHFKFLYRYSPIHNITPGAHFPPTLIMTAETDDRVVPMHAYKLAAALQAAQANDAPILLRVEGKAGHGFGKPTSKLINEAADLYAFIFAQMGLTLSL
jgi:prolyl oligopeptidase